ncbi:MAG: hypothetical protein ACSHX8_05110 [Opitutaceae bacterium]
MSLKRSSYPSTLAHKLLRSIAWIAIIASPVAHAQLNQGDIAFTRVTESSVTFVAFRQITVDEEIYFTDRQWRNGRFDDSTGELEYKHTVASTMQPGDQVDIDFGSDITLEFASPSNNNTSDQLLAYQKDFVPFVNGTTIERPRFLFAVFIDRDWYQWMPTPPGLVDARTYQTIGETAPGQPTVDAILDVNLVFSSLSPKTHINRRPIEWLNLMRQSSSWISQSTWDASWPSQAPTWQNETLGLSTFGGIVTIDTNQYLIPESTDIGTANTAQITLKRLLGDEGAVSVVLNTLASIDGLTEWAPEWTDVPQDLTGVTYNADEGEWIAVGPGLADEALIDSGSGFALTSLFDTNGNALAATLTDVVYHSGDQLLYAVSLEGHILSSGNGSTWAVRYTAGEPLYRIKSVLKRVGGGSTPHLFALGDSGTIVQLIPATSNWVASTAGSGALLDAAFCDLSGTGGFVVVGMNGFMAVRPTGQQNWSTLPSDFPDTHFTAVHDLGGTASGGQSSNILFAGTKGLTRRGFFNTAGGFSLSSNDVAAGPTMVDFIDVQDDFFSATSNTGVIGIGPHGAIVAYDALGIPISTINFKDGSPALFSIAKNAVGIYKAVGEYGSNYEADANVVISLLNQMGDFTSQSDVSVNWSNGDTSDKIVNIPLGGEGISSIARRRFDVTISRDNTGVGPGQIYRLGITQAEVIILDSIDGLADSVSSFGSGIHMSAVSLTDDPFNANVPWQLTFTLANRSVDASGDLFLDFEGTNQEKLALSPATLAAGASQSYTVNIQQPMKSVRIFEELLTTGELVRKTNWLINSLFYDDAWAPNGIFPGSFGSSFADIDNAPAPIVSNFTSFYNIGESLSQSAPLAEDQSSKTKDKKFGNNGKPPVATGKPSQDQDASNATSSTDPSKPDPDEEIIAFGSFGGQVPDPENNDPASDQYILMAMELDGDSTMNVGENQDVNVIGWYYVGGLSLYDSYYVTNVTWSLEHASQTNDGIVIDGDGVIYAESNPFVAYPRTGFELSASTDEFVPDDDPDVEVSPAEPLSIERDGTEIDYADWSPTGFTGGNLGETDDKDNDGYTNEFEFFFDTDPVSGSEVPTITLGTLDETGVIVTPVTAGDNLIFSLILPKDRDNYHLELEGSNDLGGSFDTLMDSEFLVTHLGENVDSNNVWSVEVLNTTPPYFIRLKLVDETP